MSKPIRVLIACDTFAPDINGAARFAERLAGGLVRNGNEVSIIAPGTDGWEDGQGRNECDPRSHSSVDDEACTAHIVQKARAAAAPFCERRLRHQRSSPT